VNAASIGSIGAEKSKKLSGSRRRLAEVISSLQAPLSLSVDAGQGLICFSGTLINNRLTGYLTALDSLKISLMSGQIFPRAEFEADLSYVE
jgi:hypothetical protein